MLGLARELAARMEAVRAFVPMVARISQKTCVGWPKRPKLREVSEKVSDCEASDVLSAQQ